MRVLLLLLPPPLLSALPREPLPALPKLGRPPNPKGLSPPPPLLLLLLLPLNLSGESLLRLVPRLALPRSCGESRGWAEGGAEGCCCCSRCSRAGYGEDASGEDPVEGIIRPP